MIDLLIPAYRMFREEFTFAQIVFSKGKIFRQIIKTHFPEYNCFAAMCELEVRYSK